MDLSYLYALIISSSATIFFRRDGGFIGVVMLVHGGGNGQCDEDQG